MQWPYAKKAAVQLRDGVSDTWVVATPTYIDAMRLGSHAATLSDGVSNAQVVPPQTRTHTVRNQYGRAAISGAFARAEHTMGKHRSLALCPDPSLPIVGSGRVVFQSGAQLRHSISSRRTKRCGSFSVKVVWGHQLLLFTHARCRCRSCTLQSPAHVV